MQHYIRKIRIISAILLGIEILALSFLVSLYFFDFIEGSKVVIEDNYLIIVFAAVFLLVDWIYFALIFQRVKSIRFKNNLQTANLFGETIQESLSFSQLGIIVVNDSHDIIWTNEIITQIDEHLLDKNILDALPQLREFQEGTNEDRVIKVKIKDIIFDVTYVKSSNVYFFKNVTDYDNLIQYSIEQAVVLGIVMIDNYEELAEGQEETSDTLSRVKTKINEYFKEYGVLLRKYSNNSYFAICNYDSLFKMKEDGFRWWIDRVGKSFALYDLVRIDHFRGFAGFYSIPYGDSTARNGSWNQAPGLELFRAIKEKYPRGRIIAEDLGFITDDVRKLLADTDFPGMKILQFAFYDENSEYLPRTYTTDNCIVYTASHDSDCTLSWLRSLRGDALERFKRECPRKKGQSALWAVMDLAMRSRANLAIVPMQDYLELTNEEGRMNVPSVASGNWTWRISPRYATAKRMEKIAALAKSTKRSK